MDFGLNKAQELFQSSVRRFLERECPPARVREQLRSPDGFSRELWRQMARLGWLGLRLPRRYGGQEASNLDWVLLHEEFGRALLPGPYVWAVDIGAQLLARFGTEAQKLRHLPPLVRGEQLLTVAWLEPEDRGEPGANTRALPQNDGLALQGVKLLVPYASSADYVLCLATSEAHGATWFLLDPRSAGVRLEALPNTTGEKLFAMKLERATVPADMVMGRPGEGLSYLRQVLELAALGACAQMAGGALAVVEGAASYARTRLQFERPIGSYQAISHPLANALMQAESARYITYEAAWNLDQGGYPEALLAMARATAAEAFREATARGLQSMGGYGYMEETDLQLYFRRVALLQGLVGDPDHAREAVAQWLLEPRGMARTGSGR